MKVLKFKKIISFLMLILMLFSVAQPVFAASGSGKWVGGQFASYIKTTDNANSQYGVLLRRLINYTTGEQRTVFCAEHGIDFDTGVVYSGEYYTPTNSTLRKACKIAYLGWYKQHGDYVINGGTSDANKKQYVLTQQFIWETLGQSSATFIDSDIQAEYVRFKSNIENQISQIQARPSFNGTTIKTTAGESKTITDTNGVLSSYKSLDKTENGIRYQHTAGNNNMTITVNENVETENIRISDSTFQSWGMIKEGTEDNDTTVFFEFPSGTQDQLYAMQYNDPVTLNLALKIETYGKLELQKLNTNGDLVNGAVFNVRGPNEYNQDITVTNGKITIKKLKKGIYTITEKSAPNGYLLNTQAYNVEVRVNQTSTQAIVNDEPTGTIQVIKKSEQGDLIKDTRFKVTADEDIKNIAKTKTYYTKGQVVANITTDSKGLAEITNLPLGKYVVEETQATTGYLLDSTKHNVTLSYKGQTEKIVLESFEKVDTTPIGEVKVYKTDDYNNKLKGAEISLYAREDIKNVAETKTWYKKDELVTKAITNEQGMVTFSNLHLGHYYVKETNAPDGYLLNAKEFDANIKYKDQTTKVIYLDVNNVIDEEPTGTISIIKKDSETGSTPQGDAELKGAVYEVFAAEDIYNKARTKKYYSRGDLVATRTMNEKGETEDIAELPLGKYIVKEKTASKGYLIDKKEYEVNLVYKDQYTKVITNKTTSNEDVKKMQLHVFKSGIKVQSGLVQGLEGAEFTIKLNSAVEKAYSQGYSYAEVWGGLDENGNKVSVNANRVSQAQVIAPTYEIITTDSNGNAYTQNKLPFGKYIIKETKTPTDFRTAVDFSFSITKDESEVKEIPQKAIHLVVNDEQFESYIKLVKKDLKSNKIVTLNSATFEIKATSDIIDRGNGKTLYRKGDKITQKLGSTTYSSFTTNADNEVIPDYSYNSDNDGKGITITPLLLPVGKYEITEIRIPTGFLQLEAPVKFEIKNVKDFDTDKDGDFIKEVVVKNEQPTGTINVNKTVALRENVDTSLVDISNLSGIQFKLTAKEDIIDMADGFKYYTKGQEVGTYNLTKEGTLKVENLPMGTYELEEIKTLDGLVLNKEKYEVKFVKKDDITKVYTENRDISNDTTIFEFSKTDITGESELEGAKLTVLDGDKVVDTWTSSDKTHKIEGLVVGKEYTLREEIAPKGFVKATVIKFKVENTKEVQKVKMIDKIVELTKTDIGGEEVEGAKIQVLDGEEIIDEWTSGKEAHKINGLEEGKTYILHEEVAPDGYVKATDVEFNVTTDKETQHEKLVNKIVKVSKTDLTNGEELEGAELEITDEEGNIIEDWTSTKEPHIVNGLEEGKTYILTEKAAPYGYEMTESITFTVTTDKETQIIEMKDMPILKNVKIIKVDAESKEVIKDKFTFAIYEDQECTKLIKEVKSDKEEGASIFEELRFGTYFIKETKAPKGYELSDRVVKVEINDKGVFIDDELAEESESTITFNFENKKIEVPQTGDNSHIKLALGILLLATLGLAYFGIKIYKSHKDNNNK